MNALKAYNVVTVVVVFCITALKIDWFFYGPNIVAINCKCKKKKKKFLRSKHKSHLNFNIRKDSTMASAFANLLQ